VKEFLTSIKAVSAAVRMRIVLLLLDDEACVCELMEVFHMAQSRLSHHLIALRDAGLLQDDKRGKWNYYRADTKKLNALNRDLLRSLSGWLDDDARVQKDRAALAKARKRTRICC
jgi:ArsR family transcriptional regulator